jgi:hypothetical protein
MGKPRRFTRKTGTRRYRKLFLVAAEGRETERIYFEMLDSRTPAIVKVKPIRSTSASSPDKVLARMKKQLLKESLREGDEAWLVVDKDQWSDAQLKNLHEWSLNDKRHELAVSNPKFEFWLLLHFENGSGVATSRQCSERLNRHWPDYAKSFASPKITAEMIEDAVRRAAERDKPPCEDWPRSTGTTVYRLIQRILESGRS